MGPLGLQPNAGFSTGCGPFLPGETRGDAPMLTGFSDPIQPASYGDAERQALARRAWITLLYNEPRTQDLFRWLIEHNQLSKPMQRLRKTINLKKSTSTVERARAALIDAINAGGKAHGIAPAICEHVTALCHQYVHWMAHDLTQIFGMYCLAEAENKHLNLSLTVTPPTEQVTLIAKVPDGATAPQRRAAIRAAKVQAIVEPPHTPHGRVPIKKTEHISRNAGWLWRRITGATYYAIAKEDMVSVSQVRASIQNTATLLQLDLGKCTVKL
jgi:hypothetical protein